MGRFSQTASVSSAGAAPGIGRPGRGEVIAMQLHRRDGACLDVQQAVAGPTLVGRIGSTGHDLSFHTDDQISVLLPRSGEVSGRVGGKPFRVRENEILILPAGTRQTRSHPGRTGRFAATSLMFPLGQIRRTAEQMGGAGPQSLCAGGTGAMLAPAKCATGQQFGTLAGLLVEELSQDGTGLSRQGEESWSNLLAEKLVAMLHEHGALEQAGAERFGPAERHVRRAEEYMHEHFAEIVTVADIARNCGVSVRSLELAFRSVRAQPPMARLTEIRLERVRRMLSGANGAGSVTAAAMECGFNHLGRFAGAYRRKFGEGPRETLRRA